MAQTAEVPRLRIGELAARVGLNAKTIRYYEEIGLLPEPERSASGYRKYGPTDADRLRFIKRVQQLGFALGEVGEVLTLRDRGEAPCSYVAKRVELRAREIDRQIAELEELEGELAKLQRRARQLPPRDPLGGGYCHILERGR